MSVTLIPLGAVLAPDETKRGRTMTVQTFEEWWKQSQGVPCDAYTCARLVWTVAHENAAKVCAVEFEKAGAMATERQSLYYAGAANGALDCAMKIRDAAK